MGIKMKSNTKTITIFDVPNESYLKLINIKVKKNYKSWTEFILGECLNESH